MDLVNPASFLEDIPPVQCSAASQEAPASQALQED